MCKLLRITARMNFFRWLIVTFIVGAINSIAFQSRTSGMEFKKITNFGRITSSRIDIDLLMISDFSLFTFFLSLNGGDRYSTKFALRNYMTVIFDQVQLLYNDVSLAKRKVKINLSGIFVALRLEDCPVFHSSNYTNFTAKIDGIDTLMGMNLWIKKFASWLPFYDHAAVITKFDMTSAYNSAVHGIAFIGTICKQIESISLSEDIGGMATAVIVAHELAHSLGASHDGQGINNDCQSSNNYLMSSLISTSGNFETFQHSFSLSKCTIREINNFINSNKNQSKCLFRRKIKRLVKKSVVEFDKKPGEKWTLQKQCKAAFGSDFRQCSNLPDNYKKEMCKRLWCKNATFRRFESCETKPYLPVLDGTSCGFSQSNKWCIKGKCVDNPTFKQSNWCRKGDLNPTTCSKFPQVTLHFLCTSKQYSDICCESCKRML